MQTGLCKVRNIIVVASIILLLSGCADLLRNMLPSKYQSSQQHVNTVKTIYKDQVKTDEVQTGSTQKAWETNERVTMQVGNLQVIFKKHNSRDALHDEFVAAVILNASGITSKFQGVCSNIMSMDVIVVDPRKLDMTKFEINGSGKNLPSDVHKVINAMRVGLEDQCGKFHVLRVDLSSNNYRDKEGKIRDYNYSGTLTAKSDWKLHDGYIRTPYDGEVVVKINYRDVFSVLGMRHKSKCELNPILTLKPLFQNKSERTFHTPASYTDYENNAKAITEFYTKTCLNTKSIRFKVSPLPKNYKCVDKNNCYIVADNSSGWDIDMSALIYAERDSGPIKNNYDMTEYLASGDIKTVKRYSYEYSLYFENFIIAYSQHCKKHIKDPVRISIGLVEIDRSTGDSKKVSKKDRIYVEREYSSRFEQAVSDNQTIGLNKVLDPTHDFGEGMMDLYDNRVAVGDMVRDHCMDPLIQNAYKNMLNF